MPGDMRLNVPNVGRCARSSLLVNTVIRNLTVLTSSSNIVPRAALIDRSDVQKETTGPGIIG